MGTSLVLQIFGQKQSCPGDLVHPEGNMNTMHPRCYNQKQRGKVRGSSNSSNLENCEYLHLSFKTFNSKQKKVNLKFTLHEVSGARFPVWGPGMWNPITVETLQPRQ